MQRLVSTSALAEQLGQAMQRLISDVGQSYESGQQQRDAIALSNEARILLHEGAEDDAGHLTMLRANEGQWIMSNAKHWPPDESTARDRAIWMAALNELVNADLVEPDASNHTFTVTAAGFTLADSFEDLRET